MTDTMLTLATNVGHRLEMEGMTIAVAESLTAGKIQDALAYHAGASVYFRGGVTAYCLEAKVNVLGVDRKEATRTNCVSEVVAEQMASGVRDLFKTTLGIGTTGYAESWGAVDNPFAHICVVGANGPSKTTVYGGPGRSRDGMRELVGAHALQLVMAVLDDPVGLKV